MIRADGVAILPDGTERPVACIGDGPWIPQVPRAVSYEIVEVWQDQVIDEVIRTITIDKAQAEVLASRAKLTVDKAYYEGYALAMGHALAVLERGLGPALVADDAVRAEAEAKVRRNGMGLE